MDGGMDVQNHIFLVSALVEYQLHAPAALSQGKESQSFLAQETRSRRSEKREFLNLEDSNGV
jgi:hypothetical protein